jgi:iron complex transport system substrate-binding protein
MTESIRVQFCRLLRVPLRFALIGVVSLACMAGCQGVPEIPDSPEKPQRIVSLVPTVTEILFAIGAGDRVVGISDFDTYPPEALDRPRVGALINPNLEMIFGLRPDLVITYNTQALLQERLAVGNIRQFPFVSGPTDHVLDSIRALGVELGLEENSERLVSEIDGTMESLRRTRPPDRPSVLLVQYRDMGTMGSFYSAGSQSYFNELIDIAGGRNLFEDVEQNAFQPSLEEVLNRGPEVIIEMLPTDQGGDAQLALRREDWYALTSIPAVQNGRVYILAEDYLLLVGPRLHRVAQDLAGVIRTETVSRN